MRATVLACGIAALLAVSANAAVQPGPDLWNGAAAGMNIDQVAERFPQAKVANGQVLEDGSQLALSTPADLAGSPADAMFFFRGKDLTAVIVERRAIASRESGRNLAEVTRIVTAATSQYGPAKRCTERRELAALNCVWVAGALKVTIGYHDFGGGSPALSVLYTAAR